MVTLSGGRGSRLTGLSSRVSRIAACPVCMPVSSVQRYGAQTQQPRSSVTIDSTLGARATRGLSPGRAAAQPGVVRVARSWANGVFIGT